MIKKVTKAVIPAAGFGTRFLPQTKSMPKEMLPVVDKPVIQYVVEQLIDAGIKDIIIVTGYHKRGIEDHFDSPNLDLIENLKMGGEKKKHMLDEINEIGNMANFVYVRQKGPYGNGTPLLNVRHLIGDEPFIYTWSDEFILSKPNIYKQLISNYDKYQSSCLASLRAVKDEDYNRYAFVGGEEIEKGVINVNSIIEKPGKENAPSDLGNISGFLFTPDIFNYLDQAVQNIDGNKELYYNDPLKLMIKDGKKVLAVEIKDAKYYDMGNKLEYLKSVVDFALQREDLKDDFGKFIKSIQISQ